MKRLIAAALLAAGTLAAQFLPTTSPQRYQRRAADPATCGVGQAYFNTVSGKIRVCYAANTWGDQLRADSAGNVAGSVTVKGTTATNSASLGPELTDATGWTAAGWTGDYATGFTHTAGNVSPLSRAIAGIANDKYYQLVFTISGRSAGSVTVSIGSTTVGVFSSNATNTNGPRATGTGDLTFTPTTDFDGKISAISVKLITPIATAVLSTTDSTGAASVQISAQSAALSNVVVGSGGTYNTTGNANSFFGIGAGRANTTGGSNNFLGSYAGYYNTTGYSNSFLGASAGYSNTTGYSNSFVGTSAGRSNTTGYSNNFLGSYAGYYNTTGYSNNFLGASAGISNTTGYSNSFLGASAGYSNTTGYSNSFMGSYAGYATGAGGVTANATTTAQKQTFVGYQAGQASATQRNYLTVIGAEATGDCANCVVLGRSADAVVMPGAVKTPASAGAACTAGEVAFDASYAYFCVAANTWRRVAHNTW